MATWREFRNGHNHNINYGEIGSTAEQKKHLNNY